MTGIIEIEGMEFFAYHGCFEAEQIVGNKFMVYACLHYNCHLLEHVGKRMLDALYAAFPQLQYAKIKISKMNPPLGGQIRCTSVTLEK